MSDRPVSALTQEGPVYFPPSNTFFTICPFRKDVRGRSWKRHTENAWPSVFRLLSTVGGSHIHTRDRPPPFATHTPLLKHSKTSWLRLTVPPSASTSAPPTPASASGSTTGTYPARSRLSPDRDARKKAPFRRHEIASRTRLDRRTRSASRRSPARNHLARCPSKHHRARRGEFDLAAAAAAPRPTRRPRTIAEKSRPRVDSSGGTVATPSEIRRWTWRLTSAGRAHQS